MRENTFVRGIFRAHDEEVPLKQVTGMRACDDVVRRRLHNLLPFSFQTSL